jgi:hypothetical protein
MGNQRTGNRKTQVTLVSLRVLEVVVIKNWRQPTRIEVT